MSRLCKIVDGLTGEGWLKKGRRPREEDWLCLTFNAMMMLLRYTLASAELLFFNSRYRITVFGRILIGQERVVWVCCGYQGRADASGSGLRKPLGRDALDRGDGRQVTVRTGEDKLDEPGYKSSRVGEGL